VSPSFHALSSKPTSRKTLTLLLVAHAESQLKVLVKQKQDKVEEIKKKTGYYSTRDLLEKYDEALRKGVRRSLLLVVLQLGLGSHSSSTALICSLYSRQAAGQIGRQAGRCTLPRHADHP